MPYLTLFFRLISIEIVYEAIERLVEGSELNRIGELLTVSTLGLIVNLVGLVAFGHAHHDHSDEDHSHGAHSHAGHSHGGHSHDDHSHSDHSHHHGHDQGDHHHHHEDHDHAAHDLGHPQDPIPSGPPSSTLSSIPATPSKPVHPHSHHHPHHQGHHDHHDHGNENMLGIYLHVLADTMGSVAVVISTLMIKWQGWSGFDPIASCVIAVLIFGSAVPLVTKSARKLLLTIPDNVEFDLRDALAGVSEIRGVVGYAVPKFWQEETGQRKIMGVIHVLASKGADMEDVKERVMAYLNAKRMDVLVQVEREGSGSCWCRVGNNGR